MANKILACVLLTPRLVQRYKMLSAAQKALYPEALENIDIREVLIEEEGENFNMAKIRNLAIDIAINEKYEWLIPMDADILLTHKLTIFPVSGFTGIRFFMQEHQDDWPDDNSVYRPSSNYLIHRDIFSKHRFFEGFTTMYWEDFDYFYNIIKKAGIEQSYTDLQGIHIWHPKRVVDAANIKRNKELFEQRQKGTICQ